MGWEEGLKGDYSEMSFKVIMGMLGVRGCSWMVESIFPICVRFRRVMQAAIIFKSRSYSECGEHIICT